MGVVNMMMHLGCCDGMLGCGVPLKGVPIPLVVTTNC